MNMHYNTMQEPPRAPTCHRICLLFRQLIRTLISMIIIIIISAAAPVAVLQS